MTQIETSKLQLFVVLAETPNIDFGYQKEEALISSFNNIHDANNELLIFYCFRQCHDKNTCLMLKTMKGKKPFINNKCIPYAWMVTFILYIFWFIKRYKL